MLLERCLRSAARPSVAVIVAHPDDETLWAGGQILARPQWDWTVVTLCRGDDADRAARFRRVLERFAAVGAMGDLDDGPDQTPLEAAEVRDAILTLLSRTAGQVGPGRAHRAFDAALTHGPQGEYTRHRRHEEVSRAVADLWRSGELGAGRLFLFAYQDGGRAYPPRPRGDAHLVETLPEELWRGKYEIVTRLYGFAADSWEAQAAGRQEAFWSFDSPDALAAWAPFEESRG